MQAPFSIYGKGIALRKGIPFRKSRHTEYSCNAKAPLCKGSCQKSIDF